MAGIQNIVDDVAGSLNVSKASVKEVTDAVFDAIRERLAQNEKVEIRGFGTLRPRFKKSWTGANPLTREKLQFPSTYQVSFKAHDKLKSAVSSIPITDEE